MTGTRDGGTYEITVGASLGTDWSEWFSGFAVNQEQSTTRLRGTVTDQAALHGLLARLRDLGIPILSVLRVSDQPAAEPPGGHRWGFDAPDSGLSKSQ